MSDTFCAKNWMHKIILLMLPMLAMVSTAKIKREIASPRLLNQDRLSGDVGRS